MCGRHRGVLACVRAVARGGGARAFFRGFWPYYVTTGPWSLLMFLAYEQYRKAAREYWPAEGHTGAPSAAPVGASNRLRVSRSSAISAAAAQEQEEEEGAKQGRRQQRRRRQREGL